MKPTLLMVTGQRRSGTTLLANLLDAQPQVTVLRDFLGVARLHRAAGSPPLGAALTLTQQEGVRQGFNRHNRALALPPDRTAELDGLADLEVGSAWSLVDFHRRVLAGAAASDDLVVGHKTTMAEQIVLPLLIAEPELRVVGIVRDPRDVLRSAARRFPDEAPFDILSRWRVGARALELAQTHEPTAERVLVVRYEDLVGDPDSTLSRLGDFLGLDHLAVPDHLTDHGSNWESNSSFGSEGAGVVRTNTLHRSADPRVDQLVEFVLREQMSWFGYDLRSAPGMSSRLGYRVLLALDRVAELGLRSSAGLGERLVRGRARLGRPEPQ